jgi:RNA polymerase sigma factor (sigma-70 family)
MSDANGVLRTLLVERYEYLLAQLVRRLRSKDVARDALHDTYLRLERTQELTVQNPIGFLLRAATNIAYDRFRAEKRRASDVEIGTALDIADKAPDPAAYAEERSQFLLLERAIASLPERRRAMLLISLKEKVPTRELARRFGLSQRHVNTELQLAREHCARILLNSDDLDGQNPLVKSSQKDAEK